MTYGGGIFLQDKDTIRAGDYLWDFDVDESGDIRTIEGEAEFRKDISFNVRITLESFLGQPIRPVVENRIEAIVLDILRDDPRITAIRQVRVVEAGANLIRVRIDVFSEVGELDFVVRVE